MTDRSTADRDTQPPAPLPWDWIWIDAKASGGGHVYLVDANGRKIAAIWGKAGEKEATADLILKAVNTKLEETAA